MIPKTYHLGPIKQPTSPLKKIKASAQKGKARALEFNSVVVRGLFPEEDD